MDLLVHIAAPTTRDDDNCYRTQALAYLNWRSLSITSLVTGEVATKQLCVSLEDAAKPKAIGNGAASSFTAALPISKLQSPLLVEDSFGSGFEVENSFELLASPLDRPEYMGELDETGPQIAVQKESHKEEPLMHGTRLYQLSQRANAEFSTFLEDTQLAVTAIESQLIYSQSSPVARVYARTPSRCLEQANYQPEILDLQLSSTYGFNISPSLTHAVGEVQKHTLERNPQDERITANAVTVTEDFASQNIFNRPGVQLPLAYHDEGDHLPLSISPSRSLADVLRPSNRQPNLDEISSNPNVPHADPSPTAIVRENEAHSMHLQANSNEDNTKLKERRKLGSPQSRLDLQKATYSVKLPQEYLKSTKPMLLDPFGPSTDEPMPLDREEVLNQEISFDANIRDYTGQSLSTCHGPILRNFPVEIFSPTPSTSLKAPSKKISHVTLTLERLSRNPDIKTRYRPNQQLRVLQTMERGHWAINTQKWSPLEQRRFWKFLMKLVTAGKTGTGTW